MKFIFGFVLLVAVCVLPGGHAFAEDKTELEEITVTATKTPRKVEEVSSRLDVIDQEEVEESKGWNVGETLETIPGVQAQTTNGAYDTHIIIRGAGAKAAYGVREIMLMVDGIPVTDPDSFTRLDMVDTSLVDRIEVVKGPNSTLYGANAAGGVINIITKNPLTVQGFRVEAEAGSYGSRSLELQYGGNAGDLFYLLNATHRGVDSWRDWNEFESYQFGGRFQYLLGEKSDIDAAVSYTDADLLLPGSLSEEEFEDDHTQQSTEWVNTARNSENLRASIAYKREMDRFGTFSSRLYLQDWEHFHPVPRKINDGGATVYGLDLQQDLPLTLLGRKNVLSLGVSLQRDDRDSEEYAYADLVTGTVNGRTVALPPYTTSYRKGMLLAEEDNTVDKWGVFLQESVWLTDNTILDLGIRYDEVKFDLNEEVYGDFAYVTSQRGTAYFNYEDLRETITIDKSWNAVSPRAGINHALNETFNVYASVGTGFQTPTQSELETNLELEPQDAVNYEAGIRGNFDGGHRFDVTYYYTTINDEIIQLLDEMGVSYYDNAGETLHQGLEVSGTLRVVEGLTFSASYAYSRFTFEDYDEMEKAGYPPQLITHSRDGNRIPLTPEHQISLALRYKHPSGLYGKVSSTTWGEYYVDTANTETYDGFTTVSAKVGYEKDVLGVYVQMDNVFDEKYAAEVKQSYGNISYSPGAPRTFLAGVSYAF